jgi:hypothetical protein
MRSRFFKHSILPIAVALLVTAVSCVYEEPEAVQVSRVTLEPATLTLAAGGSETLTATVRPKNATDKTLTWTSSETEVATVEKGVITALTAGTTTVTATTVNGKRATCEVTVTVVTAQSLEFTFTGNSITFYATAESISVDWGDSDSPKEVFNNLDRSEVGHTYANNAARTVRIRAEKLSVFICNQQQLTALDVSNCTALTALSCVNNQLSALDMSNNTKLTWLHCGDNQLSADALNRIFTYLPDLSGKEMGSIWLWGNPGAATCDYRIAENKNWEYVISALDVSKKHGVNNVGL